MATIGDPLSQTWDLLTRALLTTTPTNYPLEDSLGVITRGRQFFQRWQHQPTAQIWFYVNGGVHLEQVHAARPHRTE